MRKLIIDLDPGIGDAVAAMVALIDPQIDLLALTATAGVVSGAQATRNLYSLLAHVDPPKRPRIGSAGTDRHWHQTAGSLPLDKLHGPGGLGDFQFLAPEMHHRHESSKVLVDIVREHPHQVTILTLGPLTNIAAACERAPDFLDLVGGLVCLGGAIAAGGDITAAAETNMFLDPDAAHSVLSSSEVKTLIPLDATNPVVITYPHFQRISQCDGPAADFLKQLLPFYFRAHHQYLGMEGIWLREVAALAAVTRPQLFRTQPMFVEVERQGTLTCGATVADRRPQRASQANTSVALDVEAQGVVDYLTQLLA